MNIDKTFIINLVPRIDRLIPLIDNLKELGFDYWPFHATKHKVGWIGLLHTMRQLIKQVILETPFTCVLILEDDARFIINPTETIEKCLVQLPEDFDLLFLGCNLWQSHVYKYSDNLIQLSDAYATHAIVYSRKGLEKVLMAIEDNLDGVPFDILLKNKLMPDGKCFCSFPLLATQITSYSDIENKVTDWSRVLEVRFKEKTAHL